MCNGEIYNYDTLCKRFLDVITPNDISCIYPLFQAFDYDFKKLNNELNGEYALVILKVINNVLSDCWMSTDPYSVKPLFVCSDKDYIVFSSLLLGISKSPNIDKTKVRRLGGGEMIHFTFKDFCVYDEYSSYYQPDISNVGLLNPLTKIDEIKPQLVFSLDSAIVRRLNGDRPIGCLLSGGLDSSLVAAIACRELKERGQKLRTFSIGMTGGTDLYYARMVAEYIESEHTEVIFTPEEGISVIEDVIKTTETFDITIIRASVAQYLLAKWISENTDIKVLLNGDGADECQMGYLYNYYSPSHIDSHKDCIRLLDEIHLYDGLRADRCISRWGLEARFPYLDKNFANLCKRIHPKIKMPSKEEGKIEKWLIRSAFSKYLDIPYEVLWRTKEDFSDGISNKEKSWYKFIEESISNESVWYREVFEREFGSEVVSVIPNFWLPKWIESDNSSARTLSIYK
jgi:asparagine synthase (glutamine-hydrolysing)